jgi:hypothetical protein
MAMAMAWRWRWRGDGDGVAMAWRWRGVLGPLLPSSRFLVHRSNFLFFNMFIYIYEVKVTERCVAIGTHHHHGTAALGTNRTAPRSDESWFVSSLATA